MQSKTKKNTKKNSTKKEAKMKKRVNIKNFGVTTMIIPSPASSKINSKGELIKLRDYKSVYDPEKNTQIDELNLYNGKFDLDEERKRGRTKPKSKRCKK